MEGIQALSRLDSEHRLESRTCPGCEEDCSTTGIVHLAYTFRTCACGNPDFPHLVEQLWHLACLQGRTPDLDEALAHAAYVFEGYPDERAKRGARQVVARLEELLDSRRQRGVVQQVGSSESRSEQASGIEEATEGGEGSNERTPDESSLVG